MDVKASRLAVVAWCCCALAAAAAYAGKATDDIFITYRYAANLAQGAGLVFNPGERVFGVTDLGVAVLLGLTHLVSRAPMPILGTLLTALWLLWIAWTQLAQAAPSHRAEAMLGGLLVVVSFDLWLGQGAGPLGALALLLCGAQLSERRPLAAGALAALAVGFRPDAAIGAAILALLLWRDERRLPWRFLAGLGCGLAALGVLVWSYFGTVIPATLAAKRQFAALSPDRFTGWSGFWRPAEEVFRLSAGPCAAVLLALGLAGQWLLFSRGGRSGRLLALHSLGLAVFYTLVHVPYFIWYTVPCVIALLYGAAFASGETLRRIAVYLGVGGAARRTPAGQPAGEAVLGVTAAALVVVLASYLWTSAGFALRGGLADWRLFAYRQAGLWIKAHSPPSADTALDEVGILGFYSERPVRDLVGLVSPRAMKYAALGDLLGAFLEQPTTFVVFHTYDRRGATRPIVARPWFASAYREVARIHDPVQPAETLIFQLQSRAAIPPPRPPVPRPRQGRSQTGGEGAAPSPDASSFIVEARPDDPPR
ncbi:MAG TPA: hypothetical protein VHQ90_04755 [Thermoanaerobaculia bacterium]|nr:hypothetical protein [Thermoanaerobaculia bacterium]